MLTNFQVQQVHSTDNEQLNVVFSMVHTDQFSDSTGWQQPAEYGLPSGLC